MHSTAFYGRTEPGKPVNVCQSVILCTSILTHTPQRIYPLRCHRRRLSQRKCCSCWIRCSLQCQERQDQVHSLYYYRQRASPRERRLRGPACIAYPYSDDDMVHTMEARKMTPRTYRLEPRVACIVQPVVNFLVLPKRLWNAVIRTIIV